MKARRLVSGFLACSLLGLVFAGSAAAAPAPGDLDRSFGQRGIAVGDSFASSSWATMAVGPANEIFVLAPSVTNCGPTELCKTATLKLARYAPDGGRDPSFALTAGLEVKQDQYQHSALAVGADGKPVIAAVNDRSVTVARFGGDGFLDPTFGIGGIAIGSLGEATGNAPVVAVQPDGKVLVAYEASVSSTEGRLVVARFLASGSLDPEFGEAGKRTIGGLMARPAGLALRDDGGFALGLSRCCRGEGGSDVTVGVDRFLSNGSFDPTVAAGQQLIPRPTPTFLEAITTGPAGRLYLVVNEEQRGTVALRLTPNGALDPAFGKGGEVHLGVEVGVATNVSQIDVDSRGRLVGVAGYYGAGANVFRLRSSGAPDLTFGAGRAVEVPGFGGLNESSSGFGFQSNGRLVLILESGSSTSRSYQLARLFAGDSKVRCLGKRATIVGTNAAEKIEGTKGRDVIAAMGGADRVRGRGGNDLICGGKGRDLLFGGGGRDKVRQ